MTIVLAMGLIVSTSNRLLANDIYITQSGNGLDLDITQDGNNNNVTLSMNGTNNTLNVDQEGTAGNTVTHVSFWGPMYSYGGDINGNNNNVKIKQTITTGTDTNRVGFHIMSNDNNVDICQGGTFSSSTDTSCSDSGLPEYGGHTINLDLHSGNNDLRMGQETGSANADHYAQVYTYGGENNDVFTKQSGNGNKTLSMVIRTDGGEQSLTQRGDGVHTATIDLTGSYHTDLSLTQYSNSNQSYTLTNTCMTVGGCSVSATQN
jgi:hypothetical protein